MLNQLFYSAFVLGSWAIALFFLRFWKGTQDRLFACFALSFFALGVERIVLLLLAPEHRAHVYLIRLTAFVVLLYGIYDKNRERQGRKGKK
jgi:Family of unknown function (DUF5985)